MVVGYAGGYFVYNGQVVSLSGQLNDLELKYITLTSQYQLLQGNLTRLQGQYSTLQGQNKALQDSYSKLQGQYSALQSSYAKLEATYGGLKDAYSGLSAGTIYLNGTLYSRVSIPGAFKVTLNNAEIGKVASLVLSIDRGEPIFLSASRNIYSYIRGHIASVYDENHPYLKLSYIVINGTKYVSGFDIGSKEEYIKTPAETLEHFAGDSDDMAILQYAMMVNYLSISPSGQQFYLGAMQLQDGNQTGAVFVKGLNGLVTIFDPGAGYMTEVNHDVGAVLANTELSKYFTYYISQNQVITRFTLYRINPVDGSSTAVVNGSLSDMITFFS